MILALCSMILLLGHVTRVMREIQMGVTGSD